MLLVTLLFILKVLLIQIKVYDRDLKSLQFSRQRFPINFGIFQYFYDTAKNCH